VSGELALTPLQSGGHLVRHEEVHDHCEHEPQDDPEHLAVEAGGLLGGLPPAGRDG